MNTSYRSIVLPPLETVRAGLHRTTEALAAELAQPGSLTPKWSDVEWRLASAAAVVHGVAPLLWKHSGWTHPSWRRFLESQHRHVEVRHRRIETTLERIDTLARAAGLPVVPLKGSALHVLKTYEPGDRPMADIDLLTREEHAGQATRLLHDLGYVLSFNHPRHAVFKPATGSPPAVLGEHRDTPVNIELHTRIYEQLPASAVDISERIHPREPEPGSHPYPSRDALLSHLLLHAAGNLCKHSLRLIQLHDIALLARGMQPAEWQFLWSADVCWWAFPPLRMVVRYYHDAIPDDVLARLARDCPPWLRMVSRRRTLSQVSLSQLWLRGFRGLEWSRNPVEAARCIAHRIRPPAEEERARADEARTHLWARGQRWVSAPQHARILTWLTRRVPRPGMLYVVRAALDPARHAFD